MNNIENQKIISILKDFMNLEYDIYAKSRIYGKTLEFELLLSRLESLTTKQSNKTNLIINNIAMILNDEKYSLNFEDDCLPKAKEIYHYLRNNFYLIKR